MCGPPLCVRVSGAQVKNEFVAKIFIFKNHVKINKSQPTTMGEWAKLRKRDLQLIKMNFGAKKVSKKILKNSKLLLRPRGPIWP